MDVQATLDQLTELVERAKAVPMSASCMVNRQDLLRLIDQLRELLPTELRQAESVIQGREDVIEEGRREAERIIEQAQAEASRLVSKTEIMQTATADATRLLHDAQDKATAMREEVEDYIDRKLGNFEVVLHKTLASVEKGRTKLAGRHELAELGDLSPEDSGEMPLP